jgi:hypothetical protein
MPDDNQNELKIEAEKIDDIYQEYSGELSKLKKKQNDVISKIIKTVENEKIEEIKKSLKSQ